MPPGQKSKSLHCSYESVQRSKRKRENSILGCHEHKGPPGPLASPTTKTRLKSFLCCICSRSLHKQGGEILYSRSRVQLLLPSQLNFGSIPATTTIPIIAPQLHATLDTVTTPCHQCSKMGSEISQMLREALLITLSY